MECLWSFLTVRILLTISMSQSGRCAKFNIIFWWCSYSYSYYTDIVLHLFILYVKYALTNFIWCKMTFSFNSSSFISQFQKVRNVQEDENKRKLFSQYSDKVIFVYLVTSTFLLSVITTWNLLLKMYLKSDHFLTAVINIFIWKMGQITMYCIYCTSYH